MIEGSQELAGALMTLAQSACQPSLRPASNELLKQIIELQQHIIKIIADHHMEMTEALTSKLSQIFVHEIIVIVTQSA